MALKLHIDGAQFRDSNNREVTLHGINVGGDAKIPFTPDQPSHEPKGFLDADHVSFVGRPFPLDEAPSHFARLRRWGYNTIRYIFTWEALEHAGPGEYDEDFIKFTIDVLRVAKSYGFYVFMDPHQDCWSRFTGGSGAPLWTIYACGLDPSKFAVTEAALVQNLWPDPATFPKMIWATNYTRLACQTIITMFFAGRRYAPKCVINGVNIQDFLQGTYIAACKHLAQRIKEAGGLHQDVVIGWESLNEPNRGHIGYEDISVVPSAQKLQKGTSPTAWQAILTGSGRTAEIDTWDFGGLGPYKSGTQLVDPQGESAWLSHSAYDAKYGFVRDPSWPLGTCPWALHGVWDPSRDTLLDKAYFSVDPITGAPVDYEYFTNHMFMEHYRSYRDAIRSVFPDTIMFCQPPVLEIPPDIIGTADDDPNMVHTPHWYDGVTLMTKKWNRLWNVDVLGVLRGRYSSPVFAIKIGETAIRNCFKSQLTAIREEGREHMGVHPCVFSESGIPYDMDDGLAYRTGEYASQALAMDATHYAVEGALAGFTLWNYTASNSHEWGDQWNGEDLSILSVDDPVLPLTATHPPGEPTDSEASSSREPLFRRQSASSGVNETKGFRAAEAFVRPVSVHTHGTVLAHGFDLRGCVFTLELGAGTATPADAPTEVFLPFWHFPEGETGVAVSGGKWDVVRVPLRVDARAGQSTQSTSDEASCVQMLRWWHAAGQQRLEVRGRARKIGAAAGADDGELPDDGWAERCQQSCKVM